MLKVLNMNENSETGYIFETKIPKSVKDGFCRHLSIRCGGQVPLPWRGGGVAVIGHASDTSTCKLSWYKV